MLRRISTNCFSRLLVTLLFLLSHHRASAALIGGVEFPDGVASFADQVVSYTLGTGGVTAPHQNPAQALGVPDFGSSPNPCLSSDNCDYVSLGSGGSLTLRLLDSVLTGSGTTADDLWIFEVGADVEGTFVDISKDGNTWLSVGFIGGSTRGIDIDAFGYGINDEFTFIRLTDNPSQGGSTGATAGADIDAVGAITSRQASVQVPDPGHMLGAFLAAFGLIAARRKRALA